MPTMYREASSGSTIRLSRAEALRARAGVVDGLSDCSPDVIVGEGSSGIEVGDVCSGMVLVEDVEDVKLD